MKSHLSNVHFVQVRKNIAAENVKINIDWTERKVTIVQQGSDRFANWVRR